MEGGGGGDNQSSRRKLMKTLNTVVYYGRLCLVPYFIIVPLAEVEEAPPAMGNGYSIPPWFILVTHSVNSSMSTRAVSEKKTRKDFLPPKFACNVLLLSCALEKMGYRFGC